MLRAVLTAALALLAVAEADVIVYREEMPLVTVEDEFHDLPASFGPELPFDGLRGLLVVGEPENGCGKMAPPPTNYTDKWIVLVARLNCSFELKVRNAMAAGFDCVIVHNINSTDLETMSANNSEGINISSVFVNSDAGERLKFYTYKDGPFRIMVNGDLPFNFNTHLLLPFAVIVALCLIVIIIFMIVKCIKDRRRARRHRLPSRSLRQIPTCKFTKGDPYDTCAICLDDYQEGDRLRVLPCAHAYHVKCIDPWLTQSRRVCPVCKRRVRAAGERARADSDSADSDAPLLDEDRSGPQGGGTFEAQGGAVDPFRLARLRLLARLSVMQRVVHDDLEGLINEDNNQPANENEQSGTTEDPAPVGWSAADERARRLRVLQRLGLNDEEESNQATTENERVGRAPRGGSGRRARRERRARRSASAHAHAPPDAPAPTDAHSINTDASRGEIGVAALPAPPQQPSLDRQPSVEYR